MTCTFIEIDSDADDYKLLQPLKSVINLLSGLSEIRHASVDLGAVTKTDIEEIFKNCVTKWTNTLLSQISKPVESKFEDSFYNFKRGILSQMLARNPLFSTSLNKP